MPKPNFTESGWFYTVDQDVVGPFATFELCDDARTSAIVEMVEANVPGEVGLPDFVSESDLALQAIG